MAGALFATTSARADDSAPPKRYPPTSVRWKLVLGGLAVSGVAYTIAYLTAAQWPDVPGAAQMKIPVVGPWIALGHAGCSADNPGCGAEVPVRGIGQVLDAIAQTAGLGLIGEGLFMTTESEGAAPKAALTIQPMPIVTPTMQGFGVTARF